MSEPNDLTGVVTPPEYAVPTLFDDVDGDLQEQEEIAAARAVLPYAGTSGYAAGVATSEERARREDADGTTSRRQKAVINLLLNHYGTGGRWIGREDGVTWKELADIMGWHHGQASGVLSTLHKAGRISRLTERRDRCFVYVLPEHVNGRDTQEQGRPKQPDDGLAIALIQAEATIIRVEDVLQAHRDKGMLTVPISAVSAAIAGTVEP